MHAYVIFVYAQSACWTMVLVKKHQDFPVPDGTHANISSAAASLASSRGPGDSFTWSSSTPQQLAASLIAYGSNDTACQTTQTTSLCTTSHQNLQASIKSSRTIFFQAKVMVSTLFCNLIGGPRSWHMEPTLNRQFIIPFPRVHVKRVSERD